MVDGGGRSWLVGFIWQVLMQNVASEKKNFVFLKFKRACIPNREINHVMSLCKIIISENFHVFFM